jgi:hypothetical protein
MQNIWLSEILETGFPMDITSVFEWFAQESVFAAELTHEPRQRDWPRCGRPPQLSAIMWMQERSAKMLPTSAEPPQRRRAYVIAACNR